MTFETMENHIDSLKTLHVRVVYWGNLSPEDIAAMTHIAAMTLGHYVKTAEELYDVTPETYAAYRAGHL